MEFTINENRIISLIEDDLKNTKLVLGLQKLGLSPSQYYLNLSDTIFDILGISDNDENEHIYLEYVKLSSKIECINISSSIGFKNLANEIFIRTYPYCGLF